MSEKLYQMSRDPEDEKFHQSTTVELIQLLRNSESSKQTIRLCEHLHIRDVLRNEMKKIFK